MTACQSDGAAEQRVRQRDGHRRRSDFEQAGHVTLAGHPAPRPLDERGGQQHQAKRQQANASYAVDRDFDVVRDEPEQPGRPERAREPPAESHVRRGDPADQRQRREHREPAAGRRERGHAASHEHRAGREVHNAHRGK
jgi:hypothetical protein